MFKKVLGQVMGQAHRPTKNESDNPQTQPMMDDEDDTPPTTTLSSAELAATMLCSPAALMQLTHAQAQAVVRYMRPYAIPEGTTIFKEGDGSDTSFMLLILKGDITVETSVVNQKSGQTLTVLGPGSLVGEVALFDGHARSATCIASSDVHCAILTRQTLEELTQNDPSTAARLMTAIAHRLSERLRSCDEKIRLYSHLIRTMQQEIDALMQQQPTPLVRINSTPHWTSGGDR